MVNVRRRDDMKIICKYNELSARRIKFFQKNAKHIVGNKKNV